MGWAAEADCVDGFPTAFAGWPELLVQFEEAFLCLLRLAVVDGAVVDELELPWACGETWAGGSALAGAGDAGCCGVLA